MSIRLYGYWRSSATYRLRIALNLKGIEYDYIPVHLVKNGGEQHQHHYHSLNPAELVPTLVDEENHLILHQSMAIIEYLDEKYPDVSRLIPIDLNDKLRVRALSQDIACDIQPLANLRIIQYLKNELSATESEQKRWVVHWMEKGLAAVEKRLQHSSGDYCFADTITMADVCLIPQIYNANRFSLDLSSFPIIQRVYQNCNHLAAFDAAKPENQIDAGM
jgi:maleylacetoacetate isomerase